MDQIQISVSTAYMREPEMLRAAQGWLGKRVAEPRVLSFGCSIGDELATLKTMFPSARIAGCDVNDHALAVASRTMGSFADVFRSDEDEIHARGPFDLVCAFSSLCINPSPSDLAERYPFERFSRVIDLFAEVLAPGGVLALFNTSYLLQHTSAAAAFDVLRADLVTRNGWVDVYAPDGHRLVRAKPTPASYAQVLESVVGLTDDWDLIDGLFVLRPDSRADPTVFIEALYDPEADREFSLEFEWTRSDLDSLPDDKRDEGYIDFRRTFRIFREHAAHDPMWIEQEIWRDSVFAADPIRIGISGRNLIGHGEVAASIAESRASRRKSWRWAAPRRRG